MPLAQAEEILLRPMSTTAIALVVELALATATAGWTRELLAEGAASLPQFPSRTATADEERCGLTDSAHRASAKPDTTARRRPDWTHLES